MNIFWFVTGCLAASVASVAQMERSGIWETFAPDEAKRNPGYEEK